MKRIPLLGIEWADERGMTITSIPVRMYDGTWCIHSDEGVSYWNDSAELRKYCDECESESKADGAWESCRPHVEADRALADLIDEIVQ